jgi:hypothetical protein
MASSRGVIVRRFHPVAEAIGPWGKVGGRLRIRTGAAGLAPVGCTQPADVDGLEFESLEVLLHARERHGLRGHEMATLDVPAQHYLRRRRANLTIQLATPLPPIFKIVELVFAPEGRPESSPALQCRGVIPKDATFRRDAGRGRVAPLSAATGGSERWRFPIAATGRISFLGPFPALKCRATFRPPLRGKDQLNDLENGCKQQGERRPGRLRRRRAGSKELDQQQPVAVPGMRVMACTLTSGRRGPA